MLTCRRIAGEHRPRRADRTISHRQDGLRAAAVNHRLGDAVLGSLAATLADEVGAFWRPVRTAPARPPCWSRSRLTSRTTLQTPTSGPRRSPPRATVLGRFTCASCSKARVTKHGTVDPEPSSRSLPKRSRGFRFLRQVGECSRLPTGASPMLRTSPGCSNRRSVRERGWPRHAGVGMAPDVEYRLDQRTQGGSPADGRKPVPVANVDQPRNRWLKIKSRDAIHSATRVPESVVTVSPADGPAANAVLVKPGVWSVHERGADGESRRLRGRDRHGNSR